MHDIPLTLADVGSPGVETMKNPTSTKKGPGRYHKSGYGLGPRKIRRKIRSRGG